MSRNEPEPELEPGPFRLGQTALLATVPEAEPLVGHWRRQYDPSASAGVPAHVTVLVPFLDLARVDAAVLAELRTLIARHSSFTVRFDECRRFPDTLYLSPTPSDAFRALTAAVASRWPETPPYGGQFADVIPHLTVAQGQHPQTYDEVEQALAPHLPATATLSSVTLFTTNGTAWYPRARFPLSA